MQDLISPLMLMAVYFGLILVMSIITLIVFAIDKKNSAKETNGRIPEIVLLSLTSFGGSVGAMIGMYVLRHKTNPITKFHFAVTAWLSLIIQGGLGALIIVNWLSSLL